MDAIIKILHAKLITFFLILLSAQAFSQLDSTTTRSIGLSENNTFTDYGISYSHRMTNKYGFLVQSGYTLHEVFISHTKYFGLKGASITFLNQFYLKDTKNYDRFLFCGLGYKYVSVDSVIYEDDDNPIHDETYTSIQHRFTFKTGYGYCFHVNHFDFKLLLGFAMYKNRHIQTNIISSENINNKEFWEIVPFPLPFLDISLGYMF